VKVSTDYGEVRGKIYSALASARNLYYALVGPRASWYAHLEVWYAPGAGLRAYAQPLASLDGEELHIVDNFDGIEIGAYLKLESEEDVESVASDFAGVVASYPDYQVPHYCWLESSRVSATAIPPPNAAATGGGLPPPSSHYYEAVRSSISEHYTEPVWLYIAMEGGKIEINVNPLKLRPFSEGVYVWRREDGALIISARLTVDDVEAISRALAAALTSPDVRLARRLALALRRPATFLAAYRCR